jgi:hypothetical protein
MINIMITFKYKNSINIFMHKMSNLVKSVATASLDSLWYLSNSRDYVSLDKK